MLVEKQMEASESDNPGPFKEFIATHTDISEHEAINAYTRRLKEYW